MSDVTSTPAVDTSATKDEVVAQAQAAGIPVDPSARKADIVKTVEAALSNEYVYPLTGSTFRAQRDEFDLEVRLDDAGVPQYRRFGSSDDYVPFGDGGASSSVEACAGRLFHLGWQVTPV